MSEHLKTSSPEVSRDKIEVAVKHPEKVSYSAEEQSKKIAEAAAQVAAVEADIKPVERPAVAADDASQRPQFIDNAIRTLRMRQSLKHVQRRLKPTDRALSKVIHQPLVRNVSEVSARTVTRPSGLLGGGVLAFVGSLVYLFLAKYIGFAYNYLLFLFFFIGGFVVGVGVEYLWHALRPKPQV